MLPRFIGMIHLAPLPGAPKSQLPLADIEAKAVADAHALVAGGVDGLIIENFGDVPFRPGRVDQHTVASMTRVGLRVREAVDCQTGINVLRNDAAAALAVAKAIDAQFIRVNIHTGVMATDQGLINGRADETLRLRRQLEADSIAIVADVLVKHASPVGNPSMVDAVEDAIQRGCADAVIVSGSATGKPVGLDDLQIACQAAGDVPVYVGSGVTPERVSEMLPPAYGLIVGSWLKQGGRVHKPVDPNRVEIIANILNDNLLTSVPSLTDAGCDS